MAVRHLRKTIELSKKGPPQDGRHKIQKRHFQNRFQKTALTRFEITSVCKKLGNIKIQVSNSIFLVWVSPNIDSAHASQSRAREYLKRNTKISLSNFVSSPGWSVPIGHLIHWAQTSRARKQNSKGWPLYSFSKVPGPQLEETSQPGEETKFAYNQPGQKKQNWQTCNFLLLYISCIRRSATEIDFVYPKSILGT